jgi:hypothetical protein
MEQEDRSFIAKSAIAIGMITFCIITDDPQTILTATSVLVGSVGANWLSNLFEGAFHNHNDKWFTKDGALNHDIREALQRAFQGAVKQMKETWSKSAEYQAINKKQRQSTVALLKSLKPLRCLKKVHFPIPSMQTKNALSRWCKDRTMLMT